MPESKDVLYIVIPAYNEEANIANVVTEWYPVVEKHSGAGKSRLLVVNDGSKDSTEEILTGLMKQFPLLEAVTKPNGGHGGAVLFGYHKALDGGADYVFQTDSDGQTRPEEFEAFWERREANDMVIGWRKGRQDGFGRIVTTKVLRMVVKCFLGVYVKDANTPFRLMKAWPLAENIKLVPDGFFLSNVLLSAIYVKKGEPVEFIPITFRPRQGGVNSINMKRIFRIGKQAVKEFKQLRPVLDSLGEKS